MQNAATTRLNSAPISAASTTLAPTANPARTGATQTGKISRKKNTPMASRSRPRAMVGGMEPQQTLEKYAVVKQAPIPPSTAAMADMPARRKKKNADAPKNQRQAGARNFE